MTDRASPAERDTATPRDDGEVGYWERTVYADPLLSDLPRSDAGRIFTWLSSTFPVSGSKVDWSRVEAPHRHATPEGATAIAAVAIEEICRRLDHATPVVHVGDSLSPFAVTFDAVGAADIVAALLEVPEHHYFVAENRSWLVVVTFEGDVDIVDRDDSPMSCEQ